MKKIFSIILTLPVASVFVLGSFSAIALAEDTGSCAPPKECPVGDKTTTSSSNESTTETENTNKTEAQNLLKDLRRVHKEHTAAERKKNCEAAKNGLEHKLTNLGKNAATYQSRIDKILAKAVAYQKDNNVSVTNWDQLLAAAQAAQSKSSASIAALQSLNVNLDCSSSTVADNVATFRTAAQQARTDLKAYKMAVHDLLKALKAASGIKDTSSDTGGTQ